MVFAILADIDRTLQTVRDMWYVIIKLYDIQHFLVIEPAK